MKIYLVYRTAHEWVGVGMGQHCNRSGEPELIGQFLTMTEAEEFKKATRRSKLFIEYDFIDIQEVDIDDDLLAGSYREWVTKAQVLDIEVTQLKEQLEAYKQSSTFIKGKLAELSELI